MDNDKILARYKQLRQECDKFVDFLNECLEGADADNVLFILGDAFIEVKEELENLGVEFPEDDE